MNIVVVNKEFWKDKKVLVTGGAGFIGSHLVDALLNIGANVIIADIIPKDSIKNLEHIKDKIKLVECDVSNNKDLEKLERDVDIVFHLAAYAVPKLCEENPDLAFRVNILGTFNVLRYCLNNSIKKFVFPSSALLYGKYPKHLPIDEKHPIEIADSVYNATKKIGEDLCMFFYEKHNLPVIIFRLFNAFGPRQSTEYFFPTVILQAMKKNVIEIWNDKPIKDFTYVEDTVRALILGAESSFCGGPINIGSGREINIGDIARKTAEKFNAKVISLNKEVIGSMRLQCDNSLAKRILNWKPEISFEDGLNRTIEWFKNHENLY